MTKAFLFLYPIEEYLRALFVVPQRVQEKTDYLVATFNECINARYRKQDYRIAYAVFNDTPVYPGFDVRAEDLVIPVGMTFAEHTDEHSGAARYPSIVRVLHPLRHTTQLRIGGFHIWDSVQRVAQRAHERGIDTLVDEDLTELLIARVRDADFTPAEFRPLAVPEGVFTESFLRDRVHPWMHPAYATYSPRS